MVGKNIMSVNLYDLKNIYEKYIRKNTKNKRKLINFEKNKMNNLMEIKNVLENDRKYKCYYKIFLVSEPKIRIIMSLNLKDKVLNHYVARNILMRNLEKFLDFRNIATRKNMGVEYGRILIKKYMNEMKKKKEFYILKLDISKYFYSISHEVLKKLLKEKLKEQEYNLISNIIDSTNELYINENIKRLKKKIKKDLPKYQNGYGLPIGNMTSQFLSIFYLSPLDHKIIHDYKIKQYVRYMDDFILIHQDKNYLKKIYKLIENELEDTYKLKLNPKKSKLVSSKEGFVFLGIHYKIKNNKLICTLPSSARLRIRRKIKKKYRNFYQNNLDINTLFSSKECFLNSYKYGISYIKKWIKYYETL